MNLRHKHLVTAVVSAIGVTACAAGMTRADVLTSARVLRTPTMTVQTSQKNPLVDRIAKRLAVRLDRHYGADVPLSSLRRAISERQRLLGHTLAVHLPVTAQQTGSGDLVWNVTLQEHTSWLKPTVTSSDIRFAVDPQAIAKTLSATMPLNLPKVTDVSVIGTKTDSYGVQRVTTTGKPSAGYEFTTDDAAFRMAAAFRLQTESVTLPLRYRTGTVTLNNSGSLVTLELLSSGRSDYETSPWGRKANIKKGTEQHMDGVFVPKGSTFSFNDTLTGPVTLSRGWFDSLIIVNGSQLEPAPGGGICQVATTVYRAALLAGLHVTERAPHSLYVNYYKLFGLGLDATIYPGKQDLNFENDTPGDIVVQARTVGTEVFVDFYGVKDGRSVTLEGPYFAQNAQGSGLHRALRSNEIGWMHTVTFADGTTRQDGIISAYGKMPRSLATQVLAAKPESVATLHAAAPVQAHILQ